MILPMPIPPRPTAPRRVPVCSPANTRRAIRFTTSAPAQGDARHRRLEHVTGTNKLRLDIVTWAEALQAGYRTGMFGKWHLGAPPIEQGFDVAVEHNKIPGMRGHMGRNGEYLADVLTEKTLEFISSSKVNRGAPICRIMPCMCRCRPSATSSKNMRQRSRAGSISTPSWRR